MNELPSFKLVLSPCDTETLFPPSGTGRGPRALSADAKPIDIPIRGHNWDGAPLDVEMVGDRPERMWMAFVLGPSLEWIELYQATNGREANV